MKAEAPGPLHASHEQSASHQTLHILFFSLIIVVYETA